MGVRQRRARADSGDSARVADDALLALAWDARRGTLQPAPIPALPVAGLWLLALAQLLPIPRVVAPCGSSRLSPQFGVRTCPPPPPRRGPRPISLHPEATRRSLSFATGLLALALVAVPRSENAAAAARLDRSRRRRRRSRFYVSWRGSSPRTSCTASGARPPWRPSDRS